MDEHESNAEPKPFEVTRRTVVETGTTALLLATLPRAALAGPVDDNEPPPAPVTVELRINGHPYSLTLDSRTTLLDALREHLALTGSKKGCDHGQCGACTVLIEGHRINSCLTLAVMHDGQSVTTIEGLSHDGVPHPVQQAILDRQAAQCGFCLNGVILTAKAFLDQNPKASDAQIQQAMSGVLCRCFTHTRMFRAIKRYAREA